MNGAERPTTPESDDVSRMVRRTSAAPLSEAQLMAGYRIGWDQPCACGGVIFADPACAMGEVAEHNETYAHQAWRARG